MSRGDGGYGDLRRQRKGKDRADAGRRLCTNLAVMAFDDFFTDRQAETGAGIVGLGMQALEEGKDPFGMFRFEADVMILHREKPSPDKFADSMGSPMGGFVLQGKHV